MDAGSPQEQSVQFDTQTQKPFNRAQFNLFTVIVQVLAVLIVALLCFWLFNYAGGLGWTSTPSTLFNWHPLFLVLGFIILYAQAILIYRMLRDRPKKQLKMYHFIIQSVALLLAVLGGLAVLGRNLLQSSTNFYSLHSWLGLIVIALFICQIVGGFINYLLQKTSLKTRQNYMPIHVYFGIAAFVLAGVTSLLGIYEKILFKYSAKYSTLPGEVVVLNILGLLLAVFVLMVCYMVTKMEFKRQPNPEDNSLLQN